jgi:ubiquitin C-terminal hydrolase
VVKGEMTAEERLKADIEAGDAIVDEEAEAADAAAALNASAASGALLSPTTANTNNGDAAHGTKAFDPLDTIVGRLAELFSQLGAAAEANKVKHMNPKAAVNKIKAENIMFRNTMQQDAHEFASFLINALMEEERTILDVATRPHVTTPFQRMFKGRTVSKTFCGECDTETGLEQPMVDINVDVVQNTSLRYCTELFSAYETLTGDDKFRCNACTSPVDARRRVLFKTLPAVLFIQLKRFSYSERVGGFTKRNDRVQFAETMAIQTVDGEACRYNLAGVVIHQGTTPHMGHYVAIGRSAATRRWYRCDDETVTPFAGPRDLQRYFGVSDAIHEPGTANSATAYLLFYSRA